MFERFAAATRRVVEAAWTEARARGDATIGTEHLLLGLCRVGDGAGAALLAARGVTAATVEEDLRAATGPSDRDALASLGIDLDTVRAHVEETFGPGALDAVSAAGGDGAGRDGGGRRGARRRTRVGPDAKKALELGLRECLRAGAPAIGTEHLLLGLLHPGTGRARSLLAARGVTLEEIRADTDGHGDAAAGG